MDPNTLILSVTDFVDPRRWTWRLATAEDELLGERSVTLDSSAPEYDAFIDLDNHLRLNAAPDRRYQAERRILDRVGPWIGREVLGELGEQIVKTQLPMAIRVVVPLNAAQLMYRP